MIEWVGAKGAKIPHRIRHRSAAPFAMAGLCSRWRDPLTGECLWSCAIVVGPSDPWYSRFHHRMAMLLRPDIYDAWLDPDLTEPEKVGRILAEAPFPLEDEMQGSAISRKINNPRYDSPDCLEPDRAA